MLFFRSVLTSVYLCFSCTAWIRFNFIFLHLWKYQVLLCLGSSLLCESFVSKWAPSHVMQGRESRFEETVDDDGLHHFILSVSCVLIWVLALAWIIDLERSDSSSLCLSERVSVSSVLSIAHCHGGLSLRGRHVGLHSRATSALADVHSLCFSTFSFEVVCCWIPSFPPPQRLTPSHSCPSFCFARSLLRILPLFHLKSYHQLPSANHFLSWELWIKFKSGEFCLPPSPVCLSASNFLQLWAVTSHPRYTASQTWTLSFFDWAVCFSLRFSPQSVLEWC